MNQIYTRADQGRRLSWALTVVLMLLLGLIPPRGAAHASADFIPRSEGLPLFRSSCIDPTQPDTLIALGEATTRTFNWTTRQSSVIHPHPLTFCGPHGLLFSTHPDGSFWRFTARDQQARPVARIPTNYGSDASLQVYALEQGRLWASADGGLTWQERGQTFGQKIASIAVAQADSRTLALVVADRDAATGDMTYQIMVSSDAGASWELRHEGVKQAGAPEAWLSIQVMALGGYGAPADGFLLYLSSSYMNYSGWSMAVSLDGARSFNLVGGHTQRGGTDAFVTVLYSQDALVRLNGQRSSYSLERSFDQGKSWQHIPYPPHEQFPLGSASLMGYSASPGLLFRDPTGVWYTADMGSNWSRVHTQRDIEHTQLSPYDPTTLLLFSENGLTTVRLAGEGPLHTASVATNKASDGVYFPETAHNLSGLFRRYWEQHGGLAQFGYPKSEPFRELNPSDGKIYLVQYFERNRFEYHPELAGTPYEVLLGLLGVQFTAGRQAEAPFQPIGKPATSEQFYFPETGHTLGGSFRDYWVQHGGLALYGYPISQEFREVNEDDGQTYTVQYFERARFEWHPEHRGTPYEVLLGLLGSKLLREKGWL